MTQVFVAWTSFFFHVLCGQRFTCVAQTADDLEGFEPENTGDSRCDRQEEVLDMERRELEQRA